MAFRNFYDLLSELAEAHEKALRNAKAQGSLFNTPTSMRRRFEEDPWDLWHVDRDDFTQVGHGSALVPGHGDSQVPLIRSVRNLRVARLQSRMLDEYYQAHDEMRRGWNIEPLSQIEDGCGSIDGDECGLLAKAENGSTTPPDKVTSAFAVPSLVRRGRKLAFKDAPSDDEEIVEDVPIPRFVNLENTPLAGRASMMGRCSVHSNSSQLSFDVQEKWAHISRSLLELFPVNFRWPLQIYSRIIAKGSTAADNRGARNLGANDIEAIMVRARRGSSTFGGSQYDFHGRGRSLRASLTGAAHAKTFELWRLGAGWQALEPHSKLNVCWVLLGCTCLLFDLIFIPLQFVGLADNEDFNHISTAVLTYWSVDILVQFGVGYYVGDSVERRFSEVARMYAKTWMLFDLFCTVPMWVVVYAIRSSDHSESFRAMRLVKFARVVRIPRMVRMIKGERLVRQALEAINSQALLLSLGIFKTMASLVLFNHIAACVWLGLGKSDPLGWTHTVPNLVAEEVSPMHMYVIATHWAFTQFQGTSDVLPETLKERLFAVFYIATALINLAMFVSSLTNRISQLQSLHAERTRGLRTVELYLATHGVSGQLSVRIKRYVNWRFQLKKRSTENDKVMEMLPAQLLSDLHMEVRGPLILQHHFFSHVHAAFPRIIQALCHEAVKPFIPGPKEVIFKEGNLCTCMYIVASGIMAYMPKPRTRLGILLRPSRVSPPRFSLATYAANMMRLTQYSEGSEASVAELNESSDTTQINPGSFVAEAALWTKWEHVGQLNDAEVSSLLLLGASAFADTVRTNPRALKMAALYARRFCVAISHYGHIFTDVLDYTSLFQNDLP